MTTLMAAPPPRAVRPLRWSTCRHCAGPVTWAWITTSRGAWQTPFEAVAAAPGAARLLDVAGDLVAFEGDPQQVGAYARHDCEQGRAAAAERRSSR